MTLVNKLSKLVQFKTVSLNHVENRQALLWVKKEMKGLSVFIKDFNFNGFPALLVTSKKTIQPKLLLQAHIDVVEGSSNVFKPKVIQGKLFGRGVFDMKYAAACYIQLFQGLGNQLKDMDIGILLTTDEELGGRDGVGAAIKAGIKPKVCFLPDGGEDWNVQRSAKGIMQLRIISRGASAHSSRTWKGLNAVEELIKYIDKVKKSFVSEPCGQPDHQHNTINVSRISGGEMINQIPDYAEADLDIRFTAKTKPAVLRKVFKQAAGANIEIQELNFAHAYSVNMKDPNVAMFLKLLRKQKKNFKFVDSHGSSDARYFLNEKIPTVILRPVGGGHHTEKEWISIKDLNDFYTLMKEFSIKVARK